MPARPNLEELANRLSALPGISCSRRGELQSEFLYLTSNMRAAEVSVDSDHFWMEGWENSDPDSPSPPTQEWEAPSVEEALTVLRSWLG